MGLLPPCYHERVTALVLVMILSAAACQAFQSPWSSPSWRAAMNPVVAAVRRQSIPNTDSFKLNNKPAAGRVMAMTATDDDENDTVDDKEATVEEAADDQEENDAAPKVSDEEVDGESSIAAESSNATTTMSQESEEDTDEESSAEEEEEKEDATSFLHMSVSELEAQLEHWKQLEQEREQEYNIYIQERMRELKLKPIYERQGKIDHYRARPVYDQETERLQLGRRYAHDKAQLTQVQLDVQQQVQQMKGNAFSKLQDEWKEKHEEQEREIAGLQQGMEQQAEERKREKQEWKETQKQLSEERKREQEEWKETQEQLEHTMEQQAEERRLEQQEWKETQEQQAEERKQEQEVWKNTQNELHQAMEQQAEERRLEQAQWRARSREYEEEIQQAVQVQDDIRQEAQEAQEQLQAQHEEFTEEMVAKYEFQLLQLRDEMRRLQSDIQVLLQDLRTQKMALQESRNNATDLAEQLQQKTEELEDLTQRHHSLRSLTKQGWSVLRGRVQKRLRRSKSSEDDDDDDTTEPEEGTEDVFEAATDRMLELAEKKKQEDKELVGSMAVVQNVTEGDATSSVDEMEL